MRHLLRFALCLACIAPSLAHAQVEEDDTGATKISGKPEGDRALDHWWLGAYFRHLWIPSYVTGAFLDRAPSVTENGFGLVATYRTDGALSVQVGLGYMPYKFYGPFLASGQPRTHTEIVTSDLKFWHVTASLLWAIEFHSTAALEFGIGLDAGFLTGDAVRTEAYRDNDMGPYLACERVGVPNDDALIDGEREPYCAPPRRSPPEATTDSYDEEGEQYGVVEERVPSVMAFPMLPQIAFRVQPFKYLVLKAEFGFGIVQMWAGVSLHGSFGLFEKGPTEVFVAPDVQQVATGRVLGRVVDGESGAAVSGATVRMKGTRALSALATESDGRFVVDRLDPGRLTFDVEHPDYAKGSCAADIPKRGGDVAVECHLSARAKVGAMSGQIENEAGTPVARALVELAGPRTEQLQSDERGLFAAVDLPAGTYRVRVAADGYLAQVVELEIIPHETAMPQVILIKKPERSLVQLRKQEIVITEQVEFKSGSAEIVGDSDNLLRQVADVLLRFPQIQLVEVQGHTDNTGGRELNMSLSQARAEAVRSWLIKSGVAQERLEAKGYGPDHPIRANDTPANRGKNRRVQFIIRQQQSEVSE